MEAAALQTPGALQRLFDELRLAGYSLDPRHLAAAQKVVLIYQTQEPNGDPSRLKTILAPIFTRTPSQQRDFYQRFDRRLGKPGEPSLLGTVGPPAPPDAPVEKMMRQGAPWPLVVSAALLLFLVGFTVQFWPPQGPGSNESRVVLPESERYPVTGGQSTGGDSARSAEVPENPRFIEITQKVIPPYFLSGWTVVTALPLVILGGWLFLRWRRRSLWLERRASRDVPDLAEIRVPRLSERLFGTPEARGVALNLRRHRRVLSPELDVERTVEATVDQAGLFAPVFRERPLTPEYLFLIEESGINDHVARLFDETAERFREEGVQLERCYFHRDPRICYRDDRARSPVALGELAARTRDHRLVVIGTSDVFFQPRTGRPQRWLEWFDAWEARVLMNPRPIEQWSGNELQMLEEGFSLATASLAGFAALSQNIAVVEEEPIGTLLEGRLMAPVAPPKRKRELELDIETTQPLQALRADLAAIRERLLGRLTERDGRAAAEGDAGQALRLLSQLEAVLASGRVYEPVATRALQDLRSLFRIFRNFGEDTVGLAERIARALPASLARLEHADEDVRSTALAPGTIFRDIDAPWCPEMVMVSAGEFVMGSPDSEKSRDDDEGPQRRVLVGAFAIGRYPVTLEEYNDFAEATGRGKPRDQGWGRGRRPVIDVSWEDAQAYVGWLSEKTGQTYRLPSEAEWEYAARAGTETRYAFGDEITERQANFGRNVGKTTEVGTYPANAWGLHDMHGNVRECVEDCWHDSYKGAPEDGTAWTETWCPERVVRGGSWYDVSEILRSASRVRNLPGGRFVSLGFRVARTLTP